MFERVEGLHVPSYGFIRFPATNFVDLSSNALEGYALIDYSIEIAERFPDMVVLWP